MKTANAQEDNLGPDPLIAALIITLMLISGILGHTIKRVDDLELHVNTKTQKEK